MTDFDTRDIALDLSSTYDASELQKLNLMDEAKRWRVTVDIIKDAVTMALRFLSEESPY